MSAGLTLFCDLLTQFNASKFYSLTRRRSSPFAAPLRYPLISEAESLRSTVINQSVMQKGYEYAHRGYSTTPLKSLGTRLDIGSGPLRCLACGGRVTG